MSDRKVFVTNNAGHNMRYAEDNFGTLVSITVGSVNLRNLDRLRFEICDKIKDASEDDYVLPSGRGIVSGLVLLIWFHKYKKINMLVHQRGDTYILTTITPENLDDLWRIFSNNEKTTPIEEADNLPG